MEKATVSEMQASFSEAMTKWLQDRGYRVGLSDLNVDDIEKRVATAKRRIAATKAFLGSVGLDPLVNIANSMPSESEISGNLGSAQLFDA